MDISYPHEESFRIRAEQRNKIQFCVERVYGYPKITSHWGGYECIVSVEIYSGDFQGGGKIYTSNNR